ncbi:MAG: M23 family metallopeptidase [Clostridia bacterium]|nr:M23 family metallopeptidase [Clostridia bacterium]
MNNRFYRISAGIGVAIIALVIFCIVIAKRKDNNLAKIENETEPSVMSSTNLVEDGEENKNTAEFKEIKDSNENKNSSSSSDTKKEKVNDKAKQTSSNSNASAGTSKNNGNSKSNEKNVSKSTTKSTTKQEEIIKDPVFKYPVEGEITTNYAKDKLVYSDTLGEWVTHLGIDIKASKTAIVAASADGKIKSIKNDPRYGLTVVVEHVNGYSTIYSNLLTAEFVSVGENVKAGQTLGTVGNTASFEILDEPHLHFEMMKNGEQIDPNMYLKK